MKRATAFVALAAITACSLLAGAQQPASPGKKPLATRSAEGGAPLAGREGAEPTLKDGGSSVKGGAVLEQKTASADGGSRVFRFGEVEVEGRLKSPQIVYFLRRVRAEFAASDLGHRSFMREMSETKNEPSF